MQSIRDMKFKTKLTVLVTTATVGLLVIGVAAFVTLGKMKGGGAMSADLLNESRISLLAISAVTTGLVCSLGVIIARSILGPLDQTMRVLQSLAAGEKITHAALEAGYSTPSAFIAMFRKTLGTTPRRYFENSSNGAA